MQSSEIRKRFIAFFEKRGHTVIPSAPLVPLNDPSVLFNTAGMQPLVPYLLGEKHPAGTRIVDVQKCVRTGDLDDIGDNRHFSFFEMLGNWSLGDYFKEDAIKWSYEFLTSKEEGLGLDVSRLYVTAFAGDENAPKDTESATMWMSLGIPEHRIYFLGADDNWWSPGDNGPCGPCSEMFYDMTEAGVGDLDPADFVQAVKDERVIEIWNDVFMEYEKKDGKVVGKLSQKNVDTGAGLERITAVMQGKQTAYDTDIFEKIMQSVNSQTSVENEKAKRIISDHIRTASFMIADAVAPSNTGRGYILRRLLRRAIRYSGVLKMSEGSLLVVADGVIKTYQNVYSEISEKKGDIIQLIADEEHQFKQTLERGMKEFEKGEDPFVLATTYGFPIELTQELAAEKGQTLNLEDFYTKMEAHQNLSRTASAGMFKGGLANHNEKTIRLHTAHHLLLAALQTVLGPEVKQRGSNITEERLRMDFAFSRKMTDEEKKRVEDIVNEEITKGLSVVRREMPREEAEKIGAEMEFGAKYPDVVSVYFIEDAEGAAISKEFCGGPHVANTRELGIFKIQKEEASSQGVRRIKAVLE
jgi:alanyl-tRNA synthetase